MELTPESISAFQQGQVIERVQTRVARVAMDEAERQGGAAVSLIASAAKVARGGGDRTGSEKAPGVNNGLGGRVDLRA